MAAQRWRLILARSADAPDLGQREQIAAWNDTLVAAGLRTSSPADQTRFVPGLPIPLGLTSDWEPADLLIPDRHTSHDVRARFGSHLPTGYRLVDLHDVWIGEPPLPGLVVAADYILDVGLAPDVSGQPVTSPATPDLASAVERLLAAPTLQRTRSRPDRQDGGNLRPLIMDVRALSGGRLWMRLRIDPALGTGRPEEVVAALRTIGDTPFIVVRRHRQRVWLRGEDQTPAPTL